VLPRPLQEEIVAHARAEFPRECCGMIAGKSGVARRVLRCANDHPQPETRYRISARDLPLAVRIEDEGLELTAIYHSHPRSPAFPSPADRAEARWPDSLYLLVSLLGEPPELRAFRIVDRDTAVEAEVVTG